MNDIYLVACDIFSEEIDSVIVGEGYESIKPVYTRSHCAASINVLEEKFGKQEPVLDENTPCIQLHVKCSGNNCNFCKNKNDCISEIPCYSLIISDDIVNFLIEKGYYIVNVGWLMRWHFFVVDIMGFDEKTAKIFFRDTASKIMIIDTEVYGDIHEKAKEFSAYVGLDYEVFHTGLEYLKNRIRSFVEKQAYEKVNKELENSKMELQKQTADSFLLFDFIRRMSDFKTEESLVNDMLNLCTILFASEELIFISEEEGKERKYFSRNDTDDQHKYDMFLNFDGEMFKTQSGKGVILKLEFNSVIYGYLVLDELMFPEHVDKYMLTLQIVEKNMAMYIANVRYLDALKKAKETAEESAFIISQQKEELSAINEEISTTNESLVEINNEINLVKGKLEENNAALTIKTKLLEEADATKNMFMSILAHDLRTPFNTLIGYSDVLIKNYYKYPDDKRLSFINIINTASNSTYLLLEDLLMWSRSQAGSLDLDKEFVSLSSLINEICNYSKPSTNSKNINLKCSVSNDILIHVDKNMISTVIRNIISNAVKFTDENGDISVTVNAESNYVNFEIKDTGIGMDDDTLNSLFKIGKTRSVVGTKGEKGTGFGLLLCKELVEKHNGTLSVESELGTGSIFKIILPIDSD